MQASRRTVLAAGISGWLTAAASPIFAQTKNDMTITIDDPRYAQYLEARRRVWSSIGKVDDDVMAYMVSPQFSGAPAWPTTRQSYLVVRPENSVILASDGLSDLFVNTTMQDAGFECEVYIESSELVGAEFQDIRSSWQFDLIEMLAQNVANFGGINGALDQYGVISMELLAPANMPNRWVTNTGTVGALLNLQTPQRPSTCELETGVEIRLVALTIILPDENEYIVSGGAAARRELADKILATGSGVVSSSDRKSVLA